MKYVFLTLLTILMGQPALATDALTVAQILKLRHETAAARSWPEFLPIIEQLTSEPLDEDTLTQILSQAGTPVWKQIAKIHSAITKMEFDPTVPPPRSARYGEHFINREQIRSRLFQLILSLEGWTVAQESHETDSNLKKWQDIVVMNMNALCISFESGFAAPDVKEVTADYMKTIIVPIIRAIGDSYLLNGEFSNPELKLTLLNSAMALKMADLRMARVDVVLKYFGRNSLDFASVFIDPWSIAAIAAKSVINIFRSQKLRVEITRELYKTGNLITTNSYPRMTQYVFEASTKSLMCEMIFADM